MSEEMLGTTELQQGMSIMLVTKIPSPVIPFRKNSLFIIFIYCVSEGVPCVWMPVQVRKGLRLNPLELELQVFGTRHVGVGTQTLILRAAHALNL